MLEDLYAKKAGRNKLYSYQKLMSLKYKDGTPMDDYLNEMQGIINHLSSMKITFDDKLQALDLSDWARSFSSGDFSARRRRVEGWWSSMVPLLEEEKREVEMGLVEGERRGGGEIGRWGGGERRRQRKRKAMMAVTTAAAAEGRMGREKGMLLISTFEASRAIIRAAPNNEAGTI